MRKKKQTQNIYTNLNTFIDNTNTFTGFPKRNLPEQGYKTFLMRKNKVNILCNNEVRGFKGSLLVVNSFLHFFVTDDIKFYTFLKKNFTLKKN